MVDKITAYFKNSYAELRKVNWPSRQQAIKHTVAVVVFSAVLAVFLGMIDFILSWLLQRFVY
jgi:preprotein translocase subunit SecE